jgi:surface antigen
VNRVIIAGFVVVSLVGCQAVPNMQGNQGSGTIVGAATGSYIGKMMGGNNLAGGAAGAVVGFNLIRMFANKRDYAIKAFQHAAEHNSKGVTTNWHNPHDWTYGSYTPIDTIQRPDGVYRKVFTSCTQQDSGGDIKVCDCIVSMMKEKKVTLTHTDTRAKQTRKTVNWTQKRLQKLSTKKGYEEALVGLILGNDPNNLGYDLSWTTQVCEQKSGYN